MGILKQANKFVHLLPDWPWNYFARAPITHFNPAKELSEREEPVEAVYSVFCYDLHTLEEKKFTDETQCGLYKNREQVSWINIDGLKKTEIEKLCGDFGIHSLLVEDILSDGQRAKMDEIDEVIFCLLPMMYYNEGTGMIETEQVSIILGQKFVLSFQEDPKRDVFDPVRERLRMGNTKLRGNTADYLCYSLIDVIVDSYFAIIEKLNERVERLEDALLLNKEKKSLTKISMLRRSILPVRDLVSGIVRSGNDVLEERNEKYFKDVLDHITQANDYVENERDMLMNLQDLSMSQINTRLNEVMKVFTLLATLMAPATVIGGIFGMNFDVIPLTHQVSGFYITVGLMLAIPLVMLLWFRRKGWF